MSPTLLITAIIFFILSLASSLILAIADKKQRLFRPVSIVHFILLGACLTAFILVRDKSAWHYLLLFSVSTGLLLSASAIRSRSLQIVMRVYFSCYLLLIIVFIASPATLFYGISGNSTQKPNEQHFLLGDNYYLVEQQSLFHPEEVDIKYKVIRKSGMYAKTISRDLSYGFRLDSAKMILSKSDTMIVRGYSSLQSADRGFRPGMDQQQITRKQVNSTHETNQ